MPKLLFSALIAMLIAQGPAPAHAQTAAPLRTGTAAYGDWQSDAPGVRRLITPADMPAPYATRSSGNGPKIIPRPSGAVPKLPPGFTAEIMASGLETPRTIRIAPNGDIFIAESNAGRIRVLRPRDGSAKPAESAVFAQGLVLPFGLAFYPPGPDPRYLYVADTNAVLRFPYHKGDLAAAGSAERVIAELPEGTHWTRDILFPPDGRRFFLSVGSGSNVATDLKAMAPDALRRFEAAHGLGAAWGDETGRADLLVFDPDGRNPRVFATGLRNCSALALAPGGGNPWCATNERDGLGDDLPPDYVTEVRPGSFYGWPWYYIGAHEDPRHAGERPELAGKVVVPDVLLQPHSAPLGLVFYTGDQFPPDDRGSLFVALHGSWNRSRRTGYKVIRLPLKDGKATGVYEDFMTGFVAADGNVWGRPVSLAVAHDGALLMSEDANGTVWRIAYHNAGE